MGVRNKIIPGMAAHNGTEPDFVERESGFRVLAAVTAYESILRLAAKCRALLAV